MKELVIKQTYELLFAEYKSSLLTRKQAAQAIGISTATLDRLKASGLGPQYKLIGKSSKNQSVKYPIIAIAEYVYSGLVQTA